MRRGRGSAGTLSASRLSPRAELALAARRAIERDPGRLVAEEPRLPAHLVGGQPAIAALDAFWDEGDLRSHDLYRLTVAAVPVDGFWSISVYDAEGHFVKNDRDAYTVNNVTAVKDADGSVTVHFGGCDNGQPNCLPIATGRRAIALDSGQKGRPFAPLSAWWNFELAPTWRSRQERLGRDLAQDELVVAKQRRR